MTRWPWIRVECQYCTQATRRRCLVCNGTGTVIVLGMAEYVALRRRVGVLP